MGKTSLKTCVMCNKPYKSRYHNKKTCSLVCSHKLNAINQKLYMKNYMKQIRLNKSNASVSLKNSNSQVSTILSSELTNQISNI